MTAPRKLIILSLLAASAAPLHAQASPAAGSRVRVVFEADSFAGRAASSTTGSLVRRTGDTVIIARGLTGNDTVLLGRGRHLEVRAGGSSYRPTFTIIGLALGAAVGLTHLRDSSQVADCILCNSHWVHDGGQKLAMASVAGLVIGYAIGAVADKSKPARWVRASSFRAAVIPSAGGVRISGSWDW